MPTPDERRATWVEPGLAKRVVDGEVVQVAIDLNRVQTYEGNGMTVLGFPIVSTVPTPDMTPHLILTPAAIRRLARLIDPPERSSGSAAHNQEEGLRKIIAANRLALDAAKARIRELEAARSPQDEDHHEEKNDG